MPDFGRSLRELLQAGRIDPCTVFADVRPSVPLAVSLGSRVPTLPSWAATVLLPSIRSFPAETPAKLVPRLPDVTPIAGLIAWTPLSRRRLLVSPCASSARNGPNSTQTDNILSAECVAGGPLDYRDVLHASIDLIRRRKGNRWLASADAGAFHHVQPPSALISKSARGSLTEEVTATCPAK